MRAATILGAFAFVLAAVQAAPTPDAQQDENIRLTKPKDGPCSARTDGYTVEVFGDRCAKPCGGPAGSREFIPGTVKCVRRSLPLRLTRLLTCLDTSASQGHHPSRLLERYLSMPNCPKRPPLR